MPPVKMKGVQRPKNTKKTLLRLLNYMGKFKKYWGVIFFCLIISSAAGITGSYMIKPVLNNYVLPLIGHEKPDFSSFAFLLFCLALVYLSGVFCSWLSNRLQLRVMTTLLYRLRMDLFEKLQNLPVNYYDSHTHGDIMSRFTNDTDTLREMLSQALPQLMSSAFTVVGILVMMIFLSPLLALLVVVMMSLQLLLARKLGRRSAKGFKEQQKNIGIVNGYVEEMIQGQKVVKVFSHEKAALEKFDELNGNLCKAGIEANTFGTILGPVMGNLSHIQYAVVAVTGGFFVISGRLDLGTIAAFLQYTRSFTQPVSMISQLFNSILNALAGAERIFETIDQIPEADNGRVTLVNAYEAKTKPAGRNEGAEQADDKNSASSKHEKTTLVQSFSYTGEWAWKDSADNSLKKLSGKVVFDHVNFGYRAEKEVLHDICINAKPGTKIALVGSTGSGKTTVINLLSRFYDVQDEKGTIYIDDIPLNLIKKDDLRRSLGMVLQDTHLFTGTVFDNIKYGNLEASRHQVIEAAKLSNAHNFIQHLEKGYDTVLTGDASSLSQGQRQLLSIARAALKNPPILILDEATSSIDTRTEKLIQEGMDKLMQGRTSFVIAHRLSTVRNADEILVFEKGHIIERGTHEELLSQKGRYWELNFGGRK